MGAVSSGSFRPFEKGIRTQTGNHEILLGRVCTGMIR